MLRLGRRWPRTRCSLHRGGLAVLSTQTGDAKSKPGFLAAWKACRKEERRQLLVISVSGAALNVGMGVVIPALPQLSQELGFGATGVGLLLAAPSLARCLFNLPAGALVDSLGRVPCMVMGEIFAALGCLGTGLAWSLSSMLPVRFMGGTGAALAAAGSQAYLTDLTERPHLKPMRGTILGAQGGLIAAAYVVGPAIGGALTHFYGAQTAYCGVAVLIGLCGAAYATLPETMNRAMHSRTSPGVGSLFASLRSLGSAKSTILLAQAARDWQDLLRDPRQQGLFSANLALFLNYAAMITVMPLQTSRLFGLGVAEIGVLYSVGAAVGILAAPIMGTLSDKYGRVPLIAPAALLCGLGCFGVASAEVWELFVASYVTWSVGEAALAPLLSAYAADIAPKEHVGSAMSLSRQAGDLVLFLGPPLLGFIYDTSPGSSALTLTGLLTCLGAVIFRAKT
ncbi:unnamed protein product [Durusdinium trenchii]|uniref:Major facilitator superfamily (MFS) profile domain-containing protein n=1 Tax=Durusdinium trenchii TaxID=1381693 RepID=A0ABP0JZQ1_9DINO